MFSRQTTSAGKYTIIMDNPSDTIKATSDSATATSDNTEFLASLQPDAFDAVIVAGGDFPTHPVPLAVMERALMLVACDSAGEELVRRDYKPTAIVGDCDSMSAEFRAKHADIIYKV